MPNRRSLLSYAIAPAALAAGLLAITEAFGSRGAPEFVGNDAWLNTEGPLTMAGLRGKVVLVEFGTYTCINWRRTLPYVNRWNAEYGPRGLQIVGVHTPEFSFERNRPYIEIALRDLGVSFPIAQDNTFQTWRAFGNRAWPSFYLFDPAGQLRLVREGEGHAYEIETAIRDLLGLPRASSRDNQAGDADLSRIYTPEMYFGSLHESPQDPAQWPRQGEATYAFARRGGPRLNQYELEGGWARADEPLVLRSASGRVRVRFSAAKLHLVAGASQSASVQVSTDGGPPHTIEISIPTLYTLVDSNTYGQHLVEFACAAPGLSLFSATFG